MPGILPHTENGFAQTAAEQHFREQVGGENANDDPTTLKFDAVSRSPTRTPAATLTTARGVFAGWCAELARYRAPRRICA